MTPEKNEKPRPPKWEPAIRWDCAPEMFWREFRAERRLRYGAAAAARVGQAWRPAAARRTLGEP